MFKAYDKYIHTTEPYKNNVWNGLQAQQQTHIYIAVYEKVTQYYKQYENNAINVYESTTH